MEGKKVSSLLPPASLTVSWGMRATLSLMSGLQVALGGFAMGAGHQKDHAWDFGPKLLSLSTLQRGAEEDDGDGVSHQFYLHKPPKGQGPDRCHVSEHRHVPRAVDPQVCGTRTWDPPRPCPMCISFICFLYSIRYNKLGKVSGFYTTG